MARNVAALAEPAHVGDSHTTFFRQGTWLILATGLSGFFMLATQMVAQRAMDEWEWGTFFTLLRVYLLLGIPSMGLQSIFARQELILRSAVPINISMAAQEPRPFCTCATICSRSFSSRSGVGSAPGIRFSLNQTLPLQRTFSGFRSVRRQCSR